MTNEEFREAFASVGNAGKEACNRTAASLLKVVGDMEKAQSEEERQLALARLQAMEVQSAAEHSMAATTSFVGATVVIEQAVRSLEKVVTLMTDRPESASATSTSVARHIAILTWGLLIAAALTAGATIAIAIRSWTG